MVTFGSFSEHASSVKSSAWQWRADQPAVRVGRRTGPDRYWQPAERTEGQAVHFSNVTVQVWRSRPPSSRVHMPTMDANVAHVIVDSAAEPVRGLITARHIVAHGPLLVRHFGLRAYLRCVARWLRHPAKATFLEAMCQQAQGRNDPPRSRDGSRPPEPTRVRSNLLRSAQKRQRPWQQKVTGSVP